MKEQLKLQQMWIVESWKYSEKVCEMSGLNLYNYVSR